MIHCRAAYTVEESVHIWLNSKPGLVLPISRGGGSVILNANTI